MRLLRDGIRRVPAAFVGSSLIVVLLASARAEDPPPAGAAEARRVRIAERDKLVEHLQILYRTSKVDEALATLEAMLVIEQEVFGAVHEECAGSHQQIALLRELKGDFAGARARRAEVLRIRSELYPAGHWRVRESRRAIADLDRRKALTPEERRELRAADFLNPEIYQLWRAGRHREAIPIAEKAIEIRTRLVGAEHPDTALGLYNLASQHYALGDLEKAEPLYRRSLDIYRKTLGEDHPRYAPSLNSLAMLYEKMDEPVKAAATYRRLSVIYRDTLGAEHPEYAQCLTKLAVLHIKGGEYAKAEPLVRQAIEIRKKALGEDHPKYATSLSHLARLYELTGDPARAEPLFRRALDIGGKASGKDHSDYAIALNNLAALLASRGELAEAETLYRRALEIERKALGEDSPSYAIGLNNIAALHMSRSEYAKAEPLLRRATEIMARAYGEEHRESVQCRLNLAMLYTVLGEHAKAKTIYRQSLVSARDTLGEDHPDYASVLYNLACFHLATGDLAKAKPLCRMSLEITRANLDRTFAVLSERQQIRMSNVLRRTLDFYLTVSTRTEAPAVDAYGPALVWKGAVHARQARDRLRGRDPESDALLANLQRTSRRLAAHTFSVPGAAQREAWRRRIDDLSEEVEGLERQLSRRSAAFREMRTAERLTPDELRRAIPDGVTLVDVIEYDRHFMGPEGRYRTLQKEPCLMAFVVRNGGEIARVALGPSKTIDAAIDAWRRGIRRHDPRKAGQELRRLIWKPLEDHLGGSRTIVVSPDGPLNRLPLAALPGKAPGTYLLEEFSVAILAVPRLLPGLLARSREGQRKESLLALGDVDYGGSAGRDDSQTVAARSAAGSVRGGRPAFPKLAATGAEIEAIRKSFAAHHADGEVRLLGGSEATEAAFRREAGRHRWLHLATHGFFAPSMLVSALAGEGDSSRQLRRISGYHPGVLSGVALSGANTEPEPDDDDGILTALEVASLDLSGVEVVVLSACETGLGLTAGGEGVLGLQRAFQVAGARTTVTSLWKVPDEATRLLMQRFYENLWARGLPRLEALREAQLWLMREGRSHLESDGGERGVRIVDEDEDGGRGTLPPFYWAGFVLSGDWR